MSDFSVEYSAMEDAMNAVNGCANDIDTTISDLVAAFNRINGEGALIGAAASAWNEIQARWNTYTTEMPEKLHTAQNTLHAITEIYRDGDASLANQWTGVPLGGGM